jgi:integrase
VRRTLHRVKGKGLVYEPPKTPRSLRTLALPIPLVRALHEHKARQTGERMIAADEWHDEDLVFAQLNGRPIDKKADYDAWRNLLKSAGVRHVRLHDGRHTAATLLLSEGVHPRVVMELLGHSQMRTTMDIYSHVMPALAREAADRMGAVLLGDGPSRTSATYNGLQPIAIKAATRVIEDDLAVSSSPLVLGGAEGTRTPDPHTASDGATLVTGGIGRRWWAWLAPNWALLASVDTSLGPILGPTSHSVFRDASRTQPVRDG